MNQVKFDVSFAAVLTMTQTTLHSVHHKARVPADRRSRT
jgi:hypothetical protein